MIIAAIIIFIAIAIIGIIGVIVYFFVFRKPKVIAEYESKLTDIKKKYDSQVTEHQNEFPDIDPHSNKEIQDTHAKMSSIEIHIDDLKKAQDIKTNPDLILIESSWNNISKMPGIPRGINDNMMKTIKSNVAVTIFIYKIYNLKFTHDMGIVGYSPSIPPSKYDEVQGYANMVVKNLTVDDKYVDRKGMYFTFLMAYIMSAALHNIIYQNGDKKIVHMEYTNKHVDGDEFIYYK